MPGSGGTEHAQLSFAESRVGAGWGSRDARPRHWGVPLRDIAVALREGGLK